MQFPFVCDCKFLPNAIYVNLVSGQDCACPNDQNAFVNSLIVYTQKGFIGRVWGCLMIISVWIPCSLTSKSLGVLWLGVERSSLPASVCRGIKNLLYNFSNSCACVDIQWPDLPHRVSVDLDPPNQNPEGEGLVCAAGSSDWCKKSEMKPLWPSVHMIPKQKEKLIRVELINNSHQSPCSLYADVAYDGCVKENIKDISNVAYKNASLAPKWDQLPGSLPSTSPCK